MTYCFKCPECGYAVESAVRDPAPTCRMHDGEEQRMMRDWRAEGVAVDRFALRVWGKTSARQEGSVT